MLHHFYATFVIMRLYEVFTMSLENIYFSDISVEILVISWFPFSSIEHTESVLKRLLLVAGGGQADRQAGQPDV